MKKFFSLVLALVMALSLTTIAWGAEHTYTYDSSKTSEENYTALKAVIEGAADGDTVYVGAGTYTGNVQINIAEKSLTVIGEDGVLVRATDTGSQRKAFYITGKDDGSAVMNVVMKNIDIEDVNPQKASIWVRENVNVTFEDVNCASIFVDNGYNQNNTVNLNVVDCDVDKLSLEASVNNATNLDYDADSDLGIRVPWAGHNDRTNISVNDVTLTEGDVFTDEELQAALASDVDTIVLNFDAGEIDVPQGVTIVPNGYDVAVEAPAGSEVVLTTDGTYVVVPAVTRGDKFDLYVADAGMKDALAAGAEDVPALSFTEVAAKPNSDGSGNLAYIAAHNGQYFVKTTDPTVADYAVTVAGKTDVLYYASVVDVADMQYGATAKAFTNFGTKCGQLYRVDTTKEYYVIEKAEAGFALAKDDVSYVVKAGGVNVLVGNEIKTLAAAPVDDNNTVLTIDEILGHNWAVTGVKATTTGKTVPTQVTCLNCGAVVTKFYDAATKVPAGTVATAVPGYEQATNTHDAWFFVEPAAASVGGTVVTPSTDKTVTSAETFDAGIAMYVGMSVMAAAGSAVVLKKRED